MVAVEIKAGRDTATPAMARLHAFVGAARLNETVGLSAQRTIRAHLLGVNASRPNALGGSRSNFYQRAGNATTWAAVGNTVTISIAAQGIAQRFYGGPITPKAPKKFLTIPARAEAYGKSARSFPDLIVLFGKNGPYALARANQSRIGFTRGSGGRVAGIRRLGERGGEILFWLVKSVTQKPDPTILPYDAQVYANIERDVLAALGIELNRGNWPSS